MSREEALQAIKEKMDYYESDKRLRGAIETLIPELRESEDERIRKQLVDIVAFIPEANFKSASREDCRTYLEKQKEQKPWKVGENAYFTPEQKPDTRDADDLQLLGFIYDLLNEIDWKDTWAMSKDECLRRLNNYRPQKSVEWKPQPESLEALMYAIEGEWGKIEPTSYLSRRLEDLYDGLVNTFDVDEKYLGNLPKTEYTEKDIEEIKALKEKIDSSMKTKPAEWSEEYKEKIVTISEIIEHCTTIPYSGGTLTLNKEYKKELLCFIKSLRPQPQGVYKQVVHSIFKMLKDKDFYEIQPSHRVSLLNDIRVKCKDADECAEILDDPSWKPSEEQMAALEAATVRYQSTGLES